MRKKLSLRIFVPQFSKIVNKLDSQNYNTEGGGGSSGVSIYELSNS